MPPRIHVLLVEDDELAVFNTVRALRRAPGVAGVTVAIDGRDAYERLRRGGLTGDRLVVLTDLSMPRMSGLELAAALRAEPTLCEVPIVVFTNSTDDADRVAALALHVAGYFAKSSESALPDVVQACLCA